MNRDGTIGKLTAPNNLMTIKLQAQSAAAVHHIESSFEAIAADVVEVDVYAIWNQLRQGG